MIDSLRTYFGLDEEPDGDPRPAIPAGQRIYAIGDIHGRLDLFTALVAAIEADDAACAPAQTLIVLLGDLVDRGPDSAGVVQAARTLQQRRNVRILLGNHEEMFLESFDKVEVLRHFLRFGGKETLLSYGINAVATSRRQLEALQDLMAEQVPAEDIAFIRGFENRIIAGDYAFVHAGIQPGLPVGQQAPHDLRWIREPFLSHAGLHSHVIVHGHTIYEEPDLRVNRIGIDTGAFHSGRLTALVLEGTGRRFIETRWGEAGVTTLARKA